MTDMMTAGLAYANPQPPASKPGSYIDPKKAWDAATKFEGMYVSQFIQQMFQSNKEGLFGGGRTEVLFRSVFAENIAASASFNLGIAESIYPTLLKNQAPIDRHQPPGKAYHRGLKKSGIER